MYKDREMQALRSSLKALKDAFAKLTQRDRRAIVKECASGKNVTWCALIKGALLGKAGLMRRAVSARHRLNQKLIARIQRATPHVKLTIAGFGSRHPWSDYDYQVSFDLLRLDFRAFASVVAAVQDARGSIAGLANDVFPNTRVPTDNLIEVNWYLPTLLFKAPSSRVRKLLRSKFAFATHGILALQPQLRGASGEAFLVDDCLAVLRGRRVNLDSCYSRYAQLWPTFVQIRGALEGTNQIADLDFNHLLLKLVQFNPVCADMYFGVSTILFVVVHMQAAGGRSKMKELDKLAIPAALENQLLYGRTGKGKYLARTKAALKVIDKQLALSIYDKVLTVRGIRTKRDQQSLISLVRKIS